MSTTYLIERTARRQTYAAPRIDFTVVQPEAGFAASPDEGSTEEWGETDWF